MFQRGGSVVCRSAGSGRCAAEFQQLPLSVTVALDSQVISLVSLSTSSFSVRCAYFENCFTALWCAFPRYIELLYVLKFKLCGDKSSKAAWVCLDWVCDVTDWYGSIFCVYNVIRRKLWHHSHNLQFIDWEFWHWLLVDIQKKYFYITSHIHKHIHE